VSPHPATQTVALTAGRLDELVSSGAIRTLVLSMMNGVARVIMAASNANVVSLY
jgi:hypothetical protein